MKSGGRWEVGVQHDAKVGELRMCDPGVTFVRDDEEQSLTLWDGAVPQFTSCPGTVATESADRLYN